MRGAILSEHGLDNLGFITISHGSGWNFGTSDFINGYGNLCSKCPGAALPYRALSCFWNTHKNIINMDVNMVNLLKSTSFQIGPIEAKGQHSSNLGRTQESCGHR